jgi:hypothetical protein
MAQNFEILTKTVEIRNRAARAPQKGRGFHPSRFGTPAGRLNLLLTYWPLSAAAVSKPAVRPFRAAGSSPHEMTARARDKFLHALLPPRLRQGRRREGFPKSALHPDSTARAANDSTRAMLPGYYRRLIF